ncbi:MAG: PilN domain-containing protein [Acidobacteria bacterium]|nr:PilN domain-containing protein [Acidobacteriota bacterium]
MIRVNLLRDRTTRAKKPVITTETSRVGVAFIVLFLVSILVMGWWWWSLANERQEKTTQIQQLQAESQRLQKVQVEIAEFEKLKTSYEGRIQIIEALKSRQTIPVELLNNLIKSVPEAPTLWLTALTENQAGINIEGSAFNIESIADFISNLEKSGYFKSVELNFWEEGQEAIRFSLKCDRSQRVG